jgi:cell division protein FtsI/penicillin-binding protein 2
VRRRTSITLTALLTPAAVLALAACTGPDRPPAAEAADSLAAALSAVDLTGVPLATGTTADPQTHLVEVTEPLVEAAEAAGAEPAVTVAEVTEAEESDDAPPRADVTLAWSWPLTEDQTWEYTTTTELVWAPPPEDSEEAGAWETQWDTDLAVPDLAAGERLEIDTLRPDRGDVVDIDGEPLVTERDVWRVGIDKTFIEPEEWEPRARQLGEMIWADPADYVARVEAAGDKAFVEAITVRQEDPGIDFSVEDARDVHGVNVLEDTMELAPTSSFAAPVLGRSGEATEEIIEESDGAVQAGDVVGLSGLQREHDEILRGRDGLVVQVVPAESDADDGEEPRELFRVDATDGADLETTFDPDLQVLAEDVLASEKSPSALVAIRPSTGDVLAAASGPGSEGWSTATLGQYPPGSTFKVATALALLRADTFPEDTVACPEEITVNGRTYSNVPGYPASATGGVSFATAFAHSCNTAFIGAAEQVDQAALVTAAADLGLGPSTGAGFSGSVPDEASETGHAESAIGQGEVLASPLGMATVAASVAAGERVEPRLVRNVEAAEEPGAAGGDAPEAEASASPSTGADASPSASPAAADEPAADEPAADEPAGDGLTETEAADLLALMGGVVSEGSASELGDIADVVGAKTGTAQFGDGSQQHAWMLAVADDLAVAVFVEDGDRGSTTAGPLMGEFLAGR